MSTALLIPTTQPIARAWLEGWLDDGDVFRLMPSNTAAVLVASLVGRQGIRELARAARRWPMVECAVFRTRLPGVARICPEAVRGLVEPDGKARYYLDAAGVARIRQRLGRI